MTLAVVVISAILGAMIAHFSTRKTDDPKKFVPVEEEIVEPLIDPEVDDLNAFYEKTSKTEIKTTLTLEDGREEEVLALRKTDPKDRTKWYGRYGKNRPLFPWRNRLTRVTMYSNSKPAETSPEDDAGDSEA